MSLAAGASASIPRQADTSCYHHHPDYDGTRPTHEVIARLHREHLEHQAAIHDWILESRRHLTDQNTDPDVKRMM
jgi:hypothetical protein